MATELLSIGYPHTLTINQVYATPTRAANVYCSHALEFSNDTAFTTNSTLNANSPIRVAAAFVRCVVATNAIVMFKTD